MSYTILDTRDKEVLQKEINANKKNIGKLSEDKIDIPQTGKVGQILEVETVDEKGKPLTFKTVEKPSCSLPAVTEYDEGKFLKVVGGKWTAVEVTNGNEVAY